MKKKIAVYANGWSTDALMEMMSGIRKCAAKEDFDTFVYLSFAAYSEHVNITRGELNLYDLGDVSDYDGVIILSTMLNSPETAVELGRRAVEKNVPAVSIGMEMDHIPSVGIANENGMRELMTHLVEEHGVKRIVFIGGTPDHVDSAARLETARMVLAEHGHNIREEDIVFGQWGNDEPQRIVERIHESGEGLPDAFVVANDVMAMAAMTKLFELGYKVPGDTIVTGFDNSSFGKYCCPALSTVKQNYEDVAIKACEMIFDQLNGKEVSGRHMVPSSFVRAESCGCRGEIDYVAFRNSYCRDSYKRHMDSSLLEQTERVLRLRFSNILDYVSLKRMLREHYKGNHKFEGSEFQMVLASRYFGDIMAEEDELFPEGLKGQLEMVAGIKEEQVLQETALEDGKLIAYYEKKPGVQHIYYFMPLHYFQFNYGYVVMRDDPYIIEEDMLYPYMEKLQQSLKLLRINLRLDTLNKDLTRIYDKDPMTGLYNRYAYESKVNPLYEGSRVSMRPMTVLFVDINYMKRINDRYGHLHGDNAIRAVAESINDNMEDGWIAVRFGGDEFLAIIPECGEEQAESIKQSILDELDRKNNDGKRPYKISASCAYVVTDPGSNLSLQDYVKMADDLMYDVKQKVHERDGMPRK